MLRIIFHSIDGVGLGHIMRGLNIAKELRQMIDCEITFVTNTPFTRIIEEQDFKFIKGGADPYLLYTKKISNAMYLHLNEEFLLSVIKESHPDMVIFDLLMLPRVIEYAKDRHIFSVYILREIHNQRYLVSSKEYLSYFDLILTTGVKDFTFLDPKTKQSVSHENIFYVGNIFREPDNARVKEIRSKYKKRPNELLITISAGGGGGGRYLKEIREFFNFIINVANTVKLPPGARGRNSKKIRWLLIKGPLFRYNIKFPAKFEIHDYEQGLPELFAISDLVISTGGYNSINEIIASGVPALVYPLTTIMDSQIARVLAYADKGFIKFFDINDAQESVKLFKKALNPSYLNKMKEGYNGYLHSNGNKLAVGLILRKFFQSRRNKSNIGILRLDIDDISEFFIKEEASFLSSYAPLYFCGTVKTINGNGRSYFRENYHKVSANDFRLPVFSKDSLERFYSIALKQDLSLLHSEFITDAVSYLPLLKKLNLPLIVTFRGYELSDSRSKLFFSKVKPIVSQIVTKSDFQKRGLVKKQVNADKITTVYGGIDIDKIPFKFRETNKQKLKILSAGRFVEKKGFDITLKFFKELLKKYPYSKLTLIGEGELKPAIEEYIRTSGIEDKVVLGPAMPHSVFINELFKHDIFVLASRTASNGDAEGIPNVLKEAMASGMPVISTYHAGIPELIEDGKTGFLVQEDDSRGILEKAEWIIDNREKVFSVCLNARFFIEKNFNIKETSLKLESVYNKMLAPNYVKTIFEVINDKKPVKFRADLHLTSGCNGKCVMCENWKNEVSSRFERKDISKLFDNLKSFGVNYIRFHGQEPTLRKDLFDIMAQAKSRGFRVGLKTNALLFNDADKLRRLSDKVDDIYLSIDSPFKKIHNLLRGRTESFSRNIKLAKNIKTIGHCTKIYSNSVVTKLNYKSLAGILDLAHLLKIDKVSFVHLNTKNKKNIKEIMLTESQLKEFYYDIWPQILTKSLQFKIPVSVDPYFESLVGMPVPSQIKELKENPGNFDKEIRNFSKGLYGSEFYSHNTCYGILDHVTIDWEGNVYPCCAMPRSPSLAMGNVIKDSFQEIWKSERYARYRQEIMQGKCKFKNECSRNFRETAEINEYLKKDSRAVNHNEKIIQEFLNQFRYSKHMSEYKLKMMLYYAFFSSQFYREKFEDKFYLGRRNNIPELPVIKKSEIRGIFPGKDIVPNYFVEDQGTFRTSSCGSQSFLYARPLKARRYYRMATCFLNTGSWKINSAWLKLTALNCLETAEPLTAEKNNYGIDGNINKSNAIVIPPSENFLKESRAKIKQIYSLIYDSGVRLIHANPSYLKLLLYRFQKENLKLNGHYAINSTYELLLPSTKRLIETYLDCDIYDQYGCSEIGPVSFACKYGNYHVFSDSVYVEIVPAQELGRKDIGRVVITDLENRVMPFIRYFNGDFAYTNGAEECRCDLRTPLMGRVIGRQEEIVNYKGKVAFPIELDDLFLHLSNILIYQIIFNQDQFVIRVVPEDNSKKTDMHIIAEKFKDFFKDSKLKLRTELAEFILPSRRGKYNAVVVK
ncbi:MAG: glycosyltransferase [Candidatus Omnitrophota bacterium]